MAEEQKQEQQAQQTQPEQQVQPAEQTIQKKAFLDEEKKSTLIFTIMSILAGYISYAQKNSYFAILIMVSLFAVTSFAVIKLFGKKEMNWVLANGGIIYIFLWFVSWILFYNL